MTTTYYTYNPTTKRLVRASDPATIDGQMVVHPSAVMYARIGAYPEPPTMAEFKAGLPQIEWSFDAQAKEAK